MFDLIDKAYKRQRTFGSGDQNDGAANQGSDSPAIAEFNGFRARLFQTQLSKQNGLVPTAMVGSPSTVYEPDNPFKATPTQTREALDAQNLDVDGTGIKIGVLSDSFNMLGGAEGDESDGYLPDASKIKILQDQSKYGHYDEGRAMMEVVHGIAPGASLDFCSIFGTASDFRNGTDGSDQAFANAILALAQDGCKVICDDWSRAEPWFQGGVIAQAIHTVEQEGVTYLVAAGNQRSAASQTATGVSDPGFQSAWKTTSITLSHGGAPETFNKALNFGQGGFQNLTVAAGASCSLQMEWNQPWGSASSDLMIIVSAKGQELYRFDRSENPDVPGETTNLKKDPFVNEQYDPTTPTIDNTNGTSALTVQISIVNLSTIDPGEVKYIAYNRGGVPGGITIDGANAGTSVGHQESPDAIDVGAVDAGNTPFFGNSPPLSEYYSSSGTGSAWFYDIGGHKLKTPQKLDGVDISGIDDIATGDPAILDFFGTSAAAPSVAAVVALMLQGNGKLLKPDVQALLQDSAIPMINATVSGAGLVDAAKAVAFAETLRETSRGSNTLLLGTHLADTLVANGSNNVLVGGAGNDVYLINNASDQIVEDKGGGTDTVRTTVTESLAHVANVENIVLTGGTAINATGNTLANTITGNAAANVLSGGAGVDTMTGGIGSDRLTGGSGADMFVYRKGFGHDTITDFAAGSAASHDTIRIDKTLFANFANLMAHTGDSGANTLVTYDSGDKITLLGLHKADLLSADFRFV